VTLDQTRSSSFAHAYTARVAGISTPNARAQFDDGPNDGLELHRTAGLEILQHRRLVLADLLGARHALIDRIGSSMPNRFATASVSVITSRTSRETSGCRTICTSVAR